MIKQYNETKKKDQAAQNLQFTTSDTNFLLLIILNAILCFQSS